MKPIRQSAHFVVIGGGMIGMTTALELLRHKFEVTIIEPGEPGGEQSCSFGNSGWISPALVIPFSVPGLWKKVPKYLLDSHGPLTISLTHLPHLLPWLVRYLRAGSTMARVIKTAQALSLLLGDSVERHERLAHEAGASHLLAKRGQIQAYRSRADFEAEDRFWTLRRDIGAKWQVLDAGELSQKEPQLGGRYEFGVWVEGCNCVDPGAYVASLARLTTERGARLIRGTVRELTLADGRLKKVATESAEISCDAAVIAAGAWSGVLAKQVGDDLPLEAERGYHVRFSRGQGGGPANRLVLTDVKISATPSQGGFRFTGMNELAGLTAPPNWRRAEILRGLAFGSFPQLASEQAKFWMGCRPSTPDGRPVIGASRGCPDVFHAFGHGHIGISTAPNTARLLAELITGADPNGPISAFSPARFAT